MISTNQSTVSRPMRVLHSSLLLVLDPMARPTSVVMRISSQKWRPSVSKRGDIIMNSGRVRASRFRRKLTMARRNTPEMFFCLKDYHLSNISSIVTHGLLSIKQFFLKISFLLEL